MGAEAWFIWKPKPLLRARHLAWDAPVNETTLQTNAWKARYLRWLLKACGTLGPHVCICMFEGEGRVFLTQGTYK